MFANQWAEGLLNPAVLGTILGCGIPIAWIVCHFWRRVAADRSEAELIRSMVERGISVPEIERVLAARAAARPDSGTPFPSRAET